MTDIWTALGNEAASRWQIRWSEKKGAAKLSAQRSTSYIDLIRQAPALALDIANTLNTDALRAVAGTINEAALSQSSIHATHVFGSLGRDVANSINQVANEHAKAGLHTRIENVARVEIEKVNAHLAALGRRLEQEMALRSQECHRLSSDFSIRQKQETRAVTKHRIEIGLAILTAASAAWAVTSAALGALSSTTLSSIAVLFLSGVLLLINRLRN